MKKKKIIVPLVALLAVPTLAGAAAPITQSEFGMFAIGDSISTVKAKAHIARLATYGEIVAKSRDQITYSFRSSGTTSYELSFHDRTEGGRLTSKMMTSCPNIDRHAPDAVLNKIERGMSLKQVDAVVKGGGLGSCQVAKGYRLENGKARYEKHYTMKGSDGNVILSFVKQGDVYRYSGHLVSE